MLRDAELAGEMLQGTGCATSTARWIRSATPCATPISVARTGASWRAAGSKPGVSRPPPPPVASPPSTSRVVPDSRRLNAYDTDRPTDRRGYTAYKLRFILTGCVAVRCDVAMECVRCEGTFSWRMSMVRPLLVLDILHARLLMLSVRIWSY